MITDLSINVLSCAFLISSSRFSFSCASVDWFDDSLSRNDRDIVANTLSLLNTKPYINQNSIFMKIYLSSATFDFNS
jgi:hypothetical protein